MSNRIRELDDAQCKTAVTLDLQRKTDDLLLEIYKEATNGAQDQDARISKTVAKASTLFARMSADLEQVHRDIRRLTRWLVALTIAICILTLPLAYDAYLRIKQHYTDAQHHNVAP